MRIFTAIRHARNPEKYHAELWASNFLPALARIGHEVIDSAIDLEPASDFMQIADDFTAQEREVRARITQAIIDEVRAAHAVQPIDLFLSYFYNAHFDPAGFADIRALGIPTINFYCNSIYQFELVSAIAPAVDFAWHAEMDAGPAYRAIGATPIWVQMAADPNVYRPNPGVTRQNDACFVGQRYADRATLLAALHQAGVPFSVYGRGWSDGDGAPTTSPSAQARLGRPIVSPGSAGAYLAEMRLLVAHDDMVAAAWRIGRRLGQRRQARRDRAMLTSHVCGYARDVAETFAAHAVVLNFSNVWSDGRPGSRLIPHVRLRDFEGPMSRSCFLTGHTPEIEHFYEVGREIDCYRSSDELIDKTRFYLANTDAAERLREAGWQRARRDHCWENRFNQLFAACGLK